MRAVSISTGSLLPPPRAAGDLEPVDAGHEDVEDHRVGLVASRAGERLAAVVRELDLVALELERAPQRLAHGALVVDDQDLHGSILAFRL